MVGLAEQLEKLPEGFPRKPLHLQGYHPAEYLTGTCDDLICLNTQTPARSPCSKLDQYKSNNCCHPWFMWSPGACTVTLFAPVPCRRPARQSKMAAAPPRRQVCGIHWVTWRVHRVKVSVSTGSKQQIRKSACGLSKKVAGAGYLGVGAVGANCLFANLVLEDLLVRGCSNLRARESVSQHVSFI